jgi:hypothetical protein
LRNWITLLRLMASMRMARQMVRNVPASTNAATYMAMEEGGAMPQDAGHRFPYSVDA